MEDTIVYAAAVAFGVLLYDGSDHLDDHPPSLCLLLPSREYVGHTASTCKLVPSADTGLLLRGNTFVGLLRHIWPPWS